MSAFPSFSTAGRIHYHALAWVLPITMIVAAAVLSGCRTGASASGSDSPNDRVPGEYVVEMASASAGEAPLHTAFADLGIANVEALETARPLYLLRVEIDPGPRAMEARAEGIESIENVQPNYRYSGTGGKGLSEQPADEPKASE